MNGRAGSSSSARRCRRAALAALLSILALAGAALAQADASIDCRVWGVAPGESTDSRSPAGAGVVVRLSRGADSIAEKRTDGGGRLGFSGLAAGSYDLTVVSWPSELGPESASGRQISVTLGAGQRQPVNIVLIFRGGGEGAGEGGAALPDPDEAVKGLGRGLDAAKREGLGLWNERRPLVLAVLAALVALLVLRKLLRRGKSDVRTACARGVASLERLEDGLGPIDRADPRRVIDLFMAYRDSHAFSELFSLYSKMPAPLQQRLSIRQQYAFALNRAGRGDEAEGVLRSLIEERGASPETCGILGRVYKDRWLAVRDGGGEASGALLDRALDVYLQGHEAEPSNPYPGINALTLAEHSPRRAELRDRLLGEVSEALDGPREGDDYWHQATRLELALHLGRESDARAALPHVVGAAKPPKIGCPQIWKVRSTLRNQRLIVEAGERRGEAVPSWAVEVVAALEGAAG